MTDPRYVYIAQVVLRPETPGQPDDTVELIATSKALRDQLLAALDPARILHRNITEGEEHTLPQVQQALATTVVVSPDNEDDTCPCPECQAERDLAALAKQMRGLLVRGSDTTH